VFVKKIRNNTFLRNFECFFNIAFIEQKH